MSVPARSASATKIERFFARYEEGANTFDTALVGYAGELPGAGPDERKVMRDAGLLPAER